MYRAALFAWMDAVTAITTFVTILGIIAIKLGSIKILGKLTIKLLDTLLPYRCFTQKIVYWIGQGKSAN